MPPGRTLLAIRRAEVFSPGKVDADAAILDAVCERLAQSGWDVSRIKEEEPREGPRPSHVLSMVNGEDSLRQLEDWESQGAMVVNRPEAVRNCFRHRMGRILLMSGVPFPQGVIVRTDNPDVPADLDAKAGLWVKRGDFHACAEGDVSFAKDMVAYRAALKAMRDRGIAKALAQEPVEGTVVKFYATGDGAFLKAYPEQEVDLSELRVLASSAAKVLGLDVLGGDVVVGEGGEMTLIDVNDWPSFSRCREEASEAIARCVMARWA